MGGNGAVEQRRKTAELPHTDRSVLRFFRECPCGTVPDGAAYWNGVRRQAANRLVRRGLLSRRVENGNKTGYAITAAGAEMSLEGDRADG